MIVKRKTCDTGLISGNYKCNLLDPVDFFCNDFVRLGPRDFESTAF